LRDGDGLRLHAPVHAGQRLRAREHALYRADYYVDYDYHGRPVRALLHRHHVDHDHHGRWMCRRVPVSMVDRHGQLVQGKRCVCGQLPMRPAGVRRHRRL